MIIRHARFITVLLLISFTTGAQLRAEAEEESLRYACDFERDFGIFLAEAKGNGFTARLDTSSAHSARQSVQLVDAGGADVDLVWMREWDNWTIKPSKASLQWARHLTPERPIRLQKGRVYEVRAYVKTQDVHGLGLAISVWGKSGSPVRGDTSRYSPIVRGTRDWGWISARVACTAGDGELASVTLALLGKGTAWVDDVSIVEYERQEPESINFGRYPPLRMRELRVETASCLAMEFIGDLDSFQAEKPSNWLVQSDDDPDFQAGIAPATIGRIRQLDNPDGTLWWNDTYRHTIFLLLPKSLTSGRHYRVVMRNVGLDREAFMLAFEERTNVSRAIKANQYGYLPNATKFAYLGDWLGSAGPLDLAGTASEFFLVDVATGRTLFRGKPQLRLRHDQKQSFSTSDQGNLTGEDVYELDFSSFQSPGEYFVVVPGVGRSLPFRVAEDIYRQPFYHCARAIFHQRCGIELKQPYTEYVRQPCHRNPAEGIKATIIERGSEDQDQLVKESPAIKTGESLDIWGGYHDAGDYDRLIGHVRIPAVLLTLFEMFPKSFTDRQLNVPESGNGLPDLVDEARWGVDFWVRMQDPADGGVRGGAGPNAAVSDPPDRDTHPIYVYDKDPVSSLSLAAVAAQLSRVLNDLGSKQDAAFYLERAEKAWTYGNSHGGEKYRIASALAAIELYRSTGKQAYHDAFLQQAPAEFETTAQERHMGHFAWSAWMSYALCAPSVADAKVQTVCRERILAAADQELKSLEQYAYRVPYTGVGGRPLRYGWGCGTNFFSGGDFSVLAWRLTGQKQYRDAALLAADYSLGCHPAGTVFITGLGQRHIQWAMHTSSNPMGVKVGRPVAETLPGIPIFGVHAYPLGFGGWQSQLLYAYADPSAGRDDFYPPCQSWPDLRLFADVGWLPILSEFSVSSTMLHTVFLYGALMSAGDELRQ